MCKKRTAVFVLREHLKQVQMLFGGQQKALTRGTGNKKARRALLKVHFNHLANNVVVDLSALVEGNHRRDIQTFHLFLFQNKGGANSAPPTPCV